MTTPPMGRRPTELSELETKQLLQVLLISGNRLAKRAFELRIAVAAELCAGLRERDLVGCDLLNDEIGIGPRGSADGHGASTRWMPWRGSANDVSVSWPSGTTSTGVLVSRKTRSVVDPSSSLRAPRRPCELITIRSAWMVVAIAEIRAAGFPTAARHRVFSGPRAGMA